MSGVQQKLLVFRGAEGLEPCLRPDDPATHIAKFSRDDLPTLVRNEDLSLALAREVLGSAEVTKAEIGTVRGIDGAALVVERFDRSGGEKLRLEDFAQILGKPRGRAFDGKYESSYEEAAGVIQRHSARARIDLERYFRLVGFNLVIGNADAHLKNFSLLERPEGLRLSPAYDLVNTLLYPYDQETALEIGGRKRHFDTLDRRVVESFGEAIGLPKSAIGLALAELARRFAKATVPRVPPHVEADDFRVRYRDIVQGQAGRILA